MMTKQNNKKDQQTTSAANTAIDQVRTPLLAALGAGNLASQAVADTVHKAKERVTEGSETARKNLDEIPTDVEGLRERLDPAELRKVIDEYTEAALRLYDRLAESGEQAWEKISAQPQVKQALEQLDEALSSVQGRAEDVGSQARERIDDAFGKVTKRTRSAGEKAARTVNKVAEDTAEKVQDVGEDVAAETRSATRKAANKTAPKPASGRSSSASRSTGAANSGSASGSTNNSAAKKNTGGTTKSSE